MLLSRPIEHAYSVPHPDTDIIDDALLRIAAGDTDALNDLYEEAGSAVFGYALSLLKNRHDAEDVTQDTFVKICLSADQYHAMGKPMAWILRIARNIALGKLRSGNRSTFLDTDEWSAIAGDSPLDQSDDRMLLNEALKILSESESQVVFLHALAGLKHREIASLLDMTLTAVLSKYNRAIKKLRVYIEGGESK